MINCKDVMWIYLLKEQYGAAWNLLHIFTNQELSFIFVTVPIFSSSYVEVGRVNNSLYDNMMQYRIKFRVIISHSELPVGIQTFAFCWWILFSVFKVPDRCQFSSNYLSVWVESCSRWQLPYTLIVLGTRWGSWEQGETPRYVGSMRTIVVSIGHLGEVIYL